MCFYKILCFNNKNHPEYAEYCNEKEMKINNKFTEFQDKFSVKKNVVNMISEILHDKKDESKEIFENMQNNDKIQDNIKDNIKNK